MKIKVILWMNKKIIFHVFMRKIFPKNYFSLFYIFLDILFNQLLS
jgi:hypothetical protein